MIALIGSPFSSSGVDGGVPSYIGLFAGDDDLDSFRVRDLGFNSLVFLNPDAGRVQDLCFAAACSLSSSLPLLFVITGFESLTVSMDLSEEDESSKGLESVTWSESFFSTWHFSNAGSAKRNKKNL